MDSEQFQAWIDTWDARGDAMVLVLALRHMPEGTSVTKVEVPSDMWDCSPTPAVGSAILAGLKKAEDNRVRNL